MSRLRLIQCGVGGFGLAWITDFTRYSDDFELVGLVDLSRESLAAAGELCGLGEDRQFVTLGGALDGVEADAVLTVTPPPVHLVHAREAFARGLPLMTEKPIAGTIEEAIEMVGLARVSGCQLMVSQQYRYRPANLKMREVVRDGVIGELGHGHVDFALPADLAGTFRATMDFPLLIDMAVHHVDLIRYVTGRDVTRVVAFSFNPPGSATRHHAGLKMILELEGGIPFTYSGDWSARGKTTGWDGAWWVQGSEGSLHCEMEKVTVGRWRSDWWNANDSFEAMELPVLARVSQAETLHRFAESIRTGRPAETSGDDNLRTLAVIVAAMRSAVEGRSVGINEVLTEGR